MFLMAKMPKSQKGNNSVKYSMFVLQILCLFTRLLYYTKCQSRKREIIQLNIYRILPNVNQVIYSLGAICEPNVMILAQAVLEIFCSHGPLGLNA